MASVIGEDVEFAELLFVIILGWILVDLWLRVVDNFTFGTLGLNKDSTLDTLIIALVATIIFIAFIWTFHLVANAESILGTSVASIQAPALFDDEVCHSTQLQD